MVFDVDDVLVCAIVSGHVVSAVLAAWSWARRRVRFAIAGVRLRPWNPVMIFVL